MTMQHRQSAGLGRGLLKKIDVQPAADDIVIAEVRSWYDSGIRLTTWVDALEPNHKEVLPSQASARAGPPEAWKVRLALEEQGEIDAPAAKPSIEIDTSRMEVSVAAAALAGEEAVERLKSKQRETADAKRKEEEARAAAAKRKEEEARAAALAERMAMARAHEEQEQARLAEEMFERAKATVERVDREKEAYWAPRRTAKAEAAIKLELAALRTWPAEAQLAGVKAKLAPLVATPGVSADLIERLDRAMAAAERAKVEARAKAIADGVDSLLGGLAVLLPTQLPVFESAKQRLPAVEVAEVEEPSGRRPRFMPELRARALDLIRAMPPMA